MQIVLAAALSFYQISLAMNLPQQPEARDGQIPHNRTLRETMCNQDEYEYELEGLCCQMCPAGHYVKEHCTKNHNQASCSPCTSGYSAGATGLQECQRCRVCRTDEVPIKICTATSNTECRCKPGTYCASDSCQICTRCSRCRTGQRVKGKCNATKDTECETGPGTIPTSVPTTSPSSTNTTPVYSQLTSVTKDNSREHTAGYYLPVVIVLTSVLIIIIIVAVWAHCFWTRRKKKTNQRSAMENSSCSYETTSSCSTPLMNKAQPENPVPETGSLLPIDNKLIKTTEALMVSRPSEATVQQRQEGPCNREEQGNLNRSEGPDCTTEEDDEGGGGKLCSECGRPPLCDCQWMECIYIITQIVPPKHITHLARHLHVDDITIDHINSENINNIKERNYQLFCKWRTKQGQEASIITIVDKLYEMDLRGCAENIINTLKSKGIPIL